MPEPASIPAVPPASGSPRTWRRPPLIADRRLRWLLILGALGYLTLAIASLDLDWARIGEGWARGQRLLTGFLSPDFTSRWEDIQAGLLESLSMALTATAAGIALSLPVALGAARNLSPLPLYLACRGLIAVSRSLQEVIVAILFVAMVGFGPRPPTPR